MFQDTASREHAEVTRVKGRRDDGMLTAREGAATGSTRMDLCPLPNWTLDEYRGECTSLTDIKCFDARGVDGRNLVV